VPFHGDPIAGLAFKELPLNLDSRATISGWFAYKLPDRLSQLPSVDKYELIFISSTGEHTKLEQYLLRRIERNENP
jgi:hypothetical protein